MADTKKSEFFYKLLEVYKVKTYAPLLFCTINVNIPFIKDNIIYKYSYTAGSNRQY